MQENDKNVASDKLYIVPERFKQRKSELKKYRIDCRDEIIASLLCIQVRQYQNYISGKKPIPKDRLNTLCEYMHVIPEWLTGKIDRFATLHGMQREEVLDLQENEEIERTLIDYLIKEGIQTERFTDNLFFFDKIDFLNGKYDGAVINSKYIDGEVLDTVTHDTESAYFRYREVAGVVLSYNEYQAFLKEMRETIRFTAERLVNIAIASRDRFKH